MRGSTGIETARSSSRGSGTTAGGAAADGECPLDRARAAQAETEALKVSAQETTAALQETTAELKKRCRW